MLVASSEKEQAGVEEGSRKELNSKKLSLDRCRAVIMFTVLQGGDLTRTSAPFLLQPLKSTPHTSSSLSALWSFPPHPSALPFLMHNVKHCQIHSGASVLYRRLALSALCPRDLNNTMHRFVTSISGSVSLREWLEDHLDTNI
jgi:hypothetical protein